MSEQSLTSNNATDHTNFRKVLIGIIDWLAVSLRVLRLPLLIIIVLVMDTLERLMENVEELVREWPNIKKWIRTGEDG